MNTIQTLGDLKKALSRYNDDLKFEIVTSGCEALYLKTDLQISKVDTENEMFLEISLVSG